MAPACEKRYICEKEVFTACTRSLTHLCNMGNMCFKEAHYFYMMTTAHVNYLTTFLTVCYSILVLKLTYFKCTKIYRKHDIQVPTDITFCFSLNASL